MALVAMHAERALSSPVPDTTYNGWCNKPTWLVHLWLTNEPESCSETAQHVTAHQDGQRSPWCDLLDEHGTHHPDDWLRVFVEAYVQDRESTTTCGLAADLLGWTLSMVAWGEISEAFQP